MLQNAEESQYAFDVASTGYANPGQAPGHAGLSVKFRIQPVENRAMSLEAGRPIFEDKEYVRIQSASDRNVVIEREATRTDRMQYAQIYAAWKAGRDQVAAAGTPLFVLVNTVPPILKLHQAEEFKAIGVHTAEMLAAMGDTELQRFMGAREIQRKVQDWLNLQKEAAPTAKLQAQLNELKSALEVSVRGMKERDEIIDRLTRSQVQPLPLPAESKKRA